MKIIDLPNHHADPKDTPSEERVPKPPANELVTLELTPKETERPDVSAAGEDGLTSKEDRLLLQQPKLGSKAITHALEQTASDGPRKEPESAPKDSGASEETADASTPETPGMGGGEGGGNGPSDKAPGEFGGDDGERSKAQLRQQTMNDVAQTMSRLRETREAVDAELNPQDAPLINEALITLTKASDDSSANKYGGQLQDPTRSDIVNMHLAQAEAGDPTALYNLKSLLWQETAIDTSRREALAATAPHTGEVIAARDTLSGPSLLRAAVEAYEREGKSPQEFIDAAAEGVPARQREDTRRGWFLEHAGRVIPNGGEYAESIKDAAANAAREIPQKRMLRDAPHALRAVTDPATRQQVLDRYTASYFNDTQRLPLQDKPDTSVVSSLLEVASDAQKDPTVSPYELSHYRVMIDYTKNMVDRLAHEAKQAGDQPPVPTETIGSLMNQVSQWQIDYAVQDGKPAETVALQCVADAQNTIRKPYLDKDELLACGAQEFVRRGDIASARKMALASETPEGKLTVLRACWKEAGTSEEIDRMTPYRVGAHPASEHDVRRASEEHQFMRTLKSDQPDTLERHITAIADGSSSAPEEYSTTEAVALLTSRLSQVTPERAVALANTMAVRLASAATRPTLEELRPLHNILLTSNNPAHLRLVHKTITLAQGSDAEKLNALAKLAGKLTT